MVTARATWLDMDIAVATMGLAWNMAPGTSTQGSGTSIYRHVRSTAEATTTQNVTTDQGAGYTNATGPEATDPNTTATAGCICAAHDMAVDSSIGAELPVLARTLRGGRK